MVKKKGKSKRTTLKDKYKIERRINETHRKQRKQAKRDAASGVVKQQNKNNKKKDPGIPNSWPFKQDLLKEIKKTRDKQLQIQQENKNRNKKLNTSSSTTTTTTPTAEELMNQAQLDLQQFQSKTNNQFNDNNNDNDNYHNNNNNHSVGKGGGGGVGRDAVDAGQSSRRAYLRELKKVIDNADVILQVLDARDPLNSRIHPSLENIILSKHDKKMVLVLNKIDLIPKSIVQLWLTTLRRSHPTVAIKAGIRETTTTTTTTGKKKRNKNNNDDDNATMISSSSSKITSATSTLPMGMEGLLQLLKNYARTGGGGGGNNKKNNKTTISVGIIGYPNVGKSSIINALKRTRAVGVSSIPGFTTCMQEVVLDRTVRLIDSPGVVFSNHHHNNNNIDSSSSSMLLNCINIEALNDPIPYVEQLLLRCNHDSLLMTYNLPNFPKGDVMMFLAMIARSYGRVLKGGIPDKVAAAKLVMKDWNTGKIPYYTLPPKDMQTKLIEKSNDAKIVSSFDKEFDLFSSSQQQQQQDEKILNHLQDQDEMDFVCLEDHNNNNHNNNHNNEREWKQICDYMMKDESDNENDNHIEEENDNDDDEEMQDVGMKSVRAHLAKADNYDFDNM